MAASSSTPLDKEAAPKLKGKATTAAPEEDADFKAMYLQRVAEEDPEFKAQWQTKSLEVQVAKLEAEAQSSNKTISELQATLHLCQLTAQMQETKERELVARHQAAEQRAEEEERRARAALPEDKVALIKETPVSGGLARWGGTLLLGGAGLLHIALGLRYPWTQQMAWQLVSAPFAALSWPSSLSAQGAGLPPVPWDMPHEKRYFFFWYNMCGLLLLCGSDRPCRGGNAAGLAALGLGCTIAQPVHAPFWLVLLRGLLGISQKC